MAEQPSTPETPQTGSPILFGGSGLGLLLVSVFLGREAEPGLTVYVARTLFFLGIAGIITAVALWYKQAQEPEKERDPEV
jgi:hypothetical protein